MLSLTQMHLSDVRAWYWVAYDEPNSGAAWTTRNYRLCVRLSGTTGSTAVCLYPTCRSVLLLCLENKINNHEFIFMSNTNNNRVSAKENNNILLKFIF